jgi:hypothetical protein
MYVQDKIKDYYDYIIQPICNDIGKDGFHYIPAKEN